jgi:hypothetical protein
MENDETSTLPIPWRDSISPLIAPVSSVAGGDYTKYYITSSEQISGFQLEKKYLLIVDFIICKEILFLLTNEKVPHHL